MTKNSVNVALSLENFTLVNLKYLPWVSGWDDLLQLWPFLPMPPLWLVSQGLMFGTGPSDPWTCFKTGFDFSGKCYHCAHSPFWRGLTPLQDSIRQWCSCDTPFGTGAGRAQGWCSAASSLPVLPHPHTYFCMQWKSADFTYPIKYKWSANYISF